MSSNKCSQCGLVNFASTEECKRCQLPLSAQASNPPADTSPAPIQNQPPSNLFPCPDCGHGCSPIAAACPGCGRVLQVAPIQLVLPQQPARRWPRILGLLLVLYVLCWGLAADKADEQRRQRLDAELNERHKTYNVIYEIRGSAESADLTLKNEQGGTEQFSVKLPYHYELVGTTGAFLYISAQNEGEFGTVEVAIKANGKTLKQSISGGAYKIASASTRCCDY